MLSYHDDAPVVQLEGHFLIVQHKPLQSQSLIKWTLHYELSLCTKLQLHGDCINIRITKYSAKKRRWKQKENMINQINWNYLKKKTIVFIIMKDKLRFMITSLKFIVSPVDDFMSSKIMLTQQCWCWIFWWLII